MSADLDRLYSDSDSDPEFAEVLRACGVGIADEGVADLIEQDGRSRLRRGRGVTLERYLAAVPDLLDRPEVLDAALEVALRSLSGAARIHPKSVETLSAQYPMIAEAIREAAALNAALWSTTGLRDRVMPRPVKTLPCEFGPSLADGSRRYVLREVLGQGSFGQVYRAEDRQLSEAGHAAEVAIKVLSAVERTDHDRHRMIEEATKARRISHANVVQVLDRGVMDDDEDFIVYEYVAGGDLSDLMAKTKPLPPLQAATLMAQIARGVHAAHAAGVIHCDLKPSNIMLTADGLPKVADFGIAVRLGEDRRTALGGDLYAHGPIGNIAFISPEQFRGEDSAFSVPSDVYALGGMLFLLLTGVLPNGSSREEIAATHDRTQPGVGRHSPRTANQVVDRDLDAICRRALSAMPGDRQESAAALADDLERWGRREPIDWIHPSPIRRLSLWTRRKPALATATAATIAAIVVGSAIAAHFARVAQQNATDARIAQLKNEQEATIKAMKSQLAAVVTRGVRELGQNGRFLTDMLMQVWVYEQIFGSRVLGDLDLAPLLWKNRIAAIKQLLQQREDRGLGNSIESLMWESALAFWLVSQHDDAEAIALLERNIVRWRRAAEPDDPWLLELEILRQCALAGQLCASTAEQGDATSRISALLASAAALEESAIAIAEAHPRSPIHYLTLNRLADVCESEAIDQPERAVQLRNEVRELLDASQAKSSGVSEAIKNTEQAIERQSATQPAGRP